MNADKATARLSHIARRLKAMGLEVQPRNPTAPQKRLMRRFWRVADKAGSLLTPHLPPMRDGARKARTLY